MLERLSYGYCICSISPSLERMVLPGSPYNRTRVFDRKAIESQDCPPLVEIDDERDLNGAARFISEDLLLLVGEDRTTLWQRQFPEWWWGRLWLPESWILVGSVCLLGNRFVQVRRRSRHVHTL